MKNVDKT